jgi:hypothetical protein
VYDLKTESFDTRRGFSYSVIRATPRKLWDS